MNEYEPDYSVTTGKVFHECFICLRRYRRQNSRNHHMEIIHSRDLKRAHCGHCRRSFIRLCDLHRHMKVCVIYFDSNLWRCSWQDYSRRSTLAFLFSRGLQVDFELESVTSMKVSSFQRIHQSWWHDCKCAQWEATLSVRCYSVRMGADN
jgi:hypothetical protein